MSGLYNMVFEENMALPAVLLTLQEDPKFYGRLRDAWIEPGPDGALRFRVYTRNGGGNRQHYNYEGKEESETCPCQACAMKYRIPKHPLYISDIDDEYDCTYASIFFKIPEDWRERLRTHGFPEDVDLKDIALEEPVNMRERWEAALAALRNKA